MPKSTAYVFSLLIGCSPAIDKPIPPPNPPVDTNYCERMCQHLETLGCEEGEPVYNSDLPGPQDVPNQSCPAFCEELQGKGFFVNPRCVSTVPSCDQIEAYRKLDPQSCKI